MMRKLRNLFTRQIERENAVTSLNTAVTEVDQQLLAKAAAPDWEAIADELAGALEAVCSHIPPHMRGPKIHFSLKNYQAAKQVKL